MLRELRREKKKREQNALHSYDKPGTVVDNLLVLPQKAISKQYSHIKLFLRVIADGR